MPAGEWLGYRLRASVAIPHFDEGLDEDPAGAGLSMPCGWLIICWSATMTAV